MKYVDFFCGLGGGAIGASLAGLEPIGLIDNLMGCDELLSDELRPFFVNSDLQVLSPAVADLALEADVFLCSPPCQSFSTLKSRNRSAKPTELDDAFLRTLWLAIAIGRPKLIIVENAPAFLRYTDAAEFKTKIEECGYRVKFQLLDAAEMGVPQRRRRAIMVAAMREPRFAFVGKRMTVREAFAGLPPLNTRDPLHYDRKKHSDLVQRRIKGVPKDGGSRSALPKELRLACHDKTTGFHDVYGRMSWDKVAPTITGGCTNPSKGRFLHPTEDRAITLREAARLQTLPDYVELEAITSTEAKARLIGNAFPPEFAKNLILQNL